MATNIKFHRITATPGSNINTETNYVKGDVYFIKSDTDNTGKVYICTVTGKGAAATLEDYSVDTNTWRPVENNLTSTSTDSSLSAAMGKSLNESITTLSNSLPDLSNAVQITWSELKSLRDAGNLISGTQYRITDYTCTTVQENTRSAGHVFDIIVTADDESTLNEVARAAEHEGDTYFVNNDLNAWQIWYCLDNDTTRFAWADSTNGKGVIYRMIDEWNNDVPYDFKNIQFKHPNDTTTYPYYYYTFASENVENNTDLSLSISNNVNSNNISPYINSKLMAINQILFIGQACYGNSFGSNCSNNTFSSNCYSNTFGSDCYGNTFGSNCYGNTFDSKCEYLHFGSDCSYNSFGSRCESNSFESNCSYNSFGSDLYRNSFGSNCIGNVFESNCYGNSFGTDCSYNTLSPRCESNSFGKNCRGNSFDSCCSRNSFESDCSYNSFDSDCYGITFGSNSQNNTFGNGCKYIKFATDEYATSKYSYYRNNRFGDGCQYIVFTGTETAGSSAQVQNYNFAQGTCGTSSAYLTIDGVRNRAYETYISKDTDGKIKESVIAEKLDKIIEISYTKLKSLRDAGNLVPGQQYRIIDYDFTTTKTDIDSAHKLFDIIVTADSESVLNENARAMHHQYEEESREITLTGAIKLYKTDIEDVDGQGYAAEVDYGDYFLLAGTVAVDGVTYYRYDKYELLNGKEENTGRYILLESIDLDSLNISLGNPLYPVGGGTYGEAEDGGTYTSHQEDGIVAYENGTVTVTVSADLLRSRDIASWELKYTLDNVKHSSTDGKGTILWMKDEFRNECNYDFINALFKIKGEMVSTFGDNCHDNIIRQDGLAWIVFGNNCHSNTFGSDCHNNTFGSDCRNNTFGNNCYSNTFGSDCHNNTFGNDCYSNTFGNSCNVNNFGHSFYYSTFGDSCSGNSFKNTCSYITFGNACQNNTFGKNCDRIRFAIDTTGSTKAVYYQYNKIDSGVHYVNLYNGDTGAYNNQVQNYHIVTEVSGTNSNYVNIPATRNLAYETKVAKNSAGELKIYCEADLIQ